MTNRERISGVDTAWLRMEHPTNLMMIVGVMMFEERLRLADVRRVVASRFLAYRRFRSRAVQEASGAWWEEAADFSIDDHVVRARLPRPGGKAQLEEFVSELASTPLDPGRPLWQFQVVERQGGGSAVVVRIHHCYADGIALVQVMLSLTGPTARASLVAPPRRRKERAPAAAGGDFWAQVFALAAHPRGAADAAQGAVRKGAGVAADIAKLLLMGPDAPTRFKGPLGVRKRAAWADPLPLADVKAIGKALGCSINDVLLSMAAGALRDYLVGRGDATEGLEIRAIVPVNLRPAGDAGALGNQFGLVFLDLPVGIEHPLERLYIVRGRMRALKGSWQPAIALALLHAVGYGPRALQDQVTAMLASSASAVMTNVPGPPEPLYFAGRRITELDFWVPQSGGIGMGVSILSYAGAIQFGIITDAGLVPDPDAIVGRFADEFDKLVWITLMSPWGEEAVTGP